MNKLDLIVKEMLEQHEGGKIFFDHLDEAVRNKSIIDSLIGIIPQNHNIIVSGKFGRFFSNYFGEKKHSNQNIVVAVNGGLREGCPMDDLSYLDIEGKKFLFLDDSFYSGKTRDQVKEELKRQKATLSSTYIIYDGSKIKEQDVHSLYRYHNTSPKNL